jgi:hypothetical protein
MSVPSSREAKLSRLAALRRLYHHVVNGGTFLPRDAELCGFKPTKDRLATEIAKLEGETRE